MGIFSPFRINTIQVYRSSKKIKYAYVCESFSGFQEKKIARGMTRMTQKPEIVWFFFLKNEYRRSIQRLGLSVACWDWVWNFKNCPDESIVHKSVWLWVQRDSVYNSKNLDDLLFWETISWVLQGLSHFINSSKRLFSFWKAPWRVARA